MVCDAFTTDSKSSCSVRLSKIGARRQVEASRPVELRGPLVGDGFVLDEAVVARRLDGLLVEVLGVEHAGLDASELGGHEGVAVEEVLRAALGPRAVSLGLGLERA